MAGAERQARRGRRVLARRATSTSRSATRARSARARSARRHWRASTAAAARTSPRLHQVGRQRRRRSRAAPSDSGGCARAPSATRARARTRRWRSRRRTRSIAMRHIDARERRADYELLLPARAAADWALRRGALHRAQQARARGAARANRGSTSFAAHVEVPSGRCASSARCSRPSRSRSSAAAGLRGRRWGPAIRLRLRCGRLKYLRVTFKPWAERARKPPRAKAMMRGVLTRLTRATLVAWYTHVKDEKEEKEQRATRQLKRMMNAQLYGCWRRGRGTRCRCREVSGARGAPSRRRSSCSGSSTSAR